MNKAISFFLLVACVSCASIGQPENAQETEHFYRNELLQKAESLISRDFAISWDSFVPHEKGAREQYAVRMFKRGTNTLTELTMLEQNIHVKVYMSLEKYYYTIKYDSFREIECLEKVNRGNFTTVVELVRSIIKEGTLSLSKLNDEVDENLMQLNYQDLYEFHFYVKDNQIVPYKHFVFFKRGNRSMHREVENIQLNENPDLSEIDFEIPEKCNTAIKDES